MLILIAGQKLQHAILHVGNVHNAVANMLRAPDDCRCYISLVESFNSC